MVVVLHFRLDSDVLAPAEGETMTLRLAPLLAGVALLWLCCCTCRASPLLSSVSEEDEGSGDEKELELLLPASFSTRGPTQQQPTTPTAAPDLMGNIATTVIRLKDFVLSRLVDFLQENLLIIIVVTSLLIVMVFIICCASAMSHKRKLEASKPPPKSSRKKRASEPQTSAEFMERPSFSGEHVKRVQMQVQGSASPKHLRTPSKALVGERGRDVKVRKTREVEEVKPREQFRDQGKPSSSNSGSSSNSSSAQPVCTCHLKKAHH